MKIELIVTLITFTYLVKCSKEVAEPEQASKYEAELYNETNTRGLKKSLLSGFINNLLVQPFVQTTTVAPADGILIYGSGRYTLSQNIYNFVGSGRFSTGIKFTYTAVGIGDVSRAASSSSKIKSFNGKGISMLGETFSFQSRQVSTFDQGISFITYGLFENRKDAFVVTGTLRESANQEIFFSGKYKKALLSELSSVVLQPVSVGPTGFVPPILNGQRVFMEGSMVLTRGTARASTFTLQSVVAGYSSVIKGVMDLGTAGDFTKMTGSGLVENTVPINMETLDIVTLGNNIGAVLKYSIPTYSLSYYHVALAYGDGSILKVKGITGDGNVYKILQSGFGAIASRDLATIPVLAGTGRDEFGEAYIFGMTLTASNGVITAATGTAAFIGRTLSLEVTSFVQTTAGFLVQANVKAPSGTLAYYFTGVFVIREVLGVLGFYYTGISYKA